MKLLNMATLFSIATGVIAQNAASGITIPAFNITAIVGHKNASRLECWQLHSPPNVGRGATNFALGDLASGSFVGIVPPRTTGGTIGNAEYVQYSLFLDGLVHIQTPHAGLPAEKSEVYIQGGKNGWVIAADLKENAAQGHSTSFPGETNTVIAQFPCANNMPPAYTLLYTGPCRGEELSGL